MEENIQDPELLANRLLEEEEEFHHLNNPADGIKPIIKKYLGVPKNGQQLGNKFYFSDGDFASAKQLQSMMPPWRWLPKSKPHARRNIRTLCQDLADQYRKVRAEPPSVPRP